MKKKLIIIGMDGCRFDSLMLAKTPNIKKLIGANCLVWQAITTKRPSSGPAWTSMLTGVWPRKHKVINEKFQNSNFKQYPTIFEMIKKVQPKTITASIVNWEPINTKIIKNANILISLNDDSKVTKKTIDLIKNKNPDILFVHFDSIDAAGHKYGYGPIIEYIENIEKVDFLIGKLLKVIEERKKKLNEEWLIIITTDHGGSKKTHGKNNIENRKIFIITNREKNKYRKIKETGLIVDVAVMALNHFNIKSDQKGDLDGSLLFDKIA